MSTHTLRPWNRNDYWPQGTYPEPDMSIQVPTVQGFRHGYKKSVVVDKVPEPAVDWRCGNCGQNFRTESAWDEHMIGDAEFGHTCTKLPCPPPGGWTLKSLLPVLRVYQPVDKAGLAHRTRLLRIMNGLNVVRKAKRAGRGRAANRTAVLPIGTAP